MTKTSKVSSENGFFHISLSLFTAISVITGFSLWGLLHQWKGIMDTQLRLDHCTGETALDLKSKLSKVAQVNDQIENVRATIKVAMATPASAEAVPPLQLALHGLIIAQDGVQTSWNLKEVSWIARGGCGQTKDFALPLPILDWERPPPDEVGEMPVDMDSLPDDFRIEAYHLPRKSAALVERNENENWFAHWTVPSVGS
jgi:hypothetical protein